MITAEEIINLFGMKPLPVEGGYYIETYRSKEKIAQAALPDRLVGERDFSTAILYLLTPDTFSKMHKLISDEIYHFYLGDPVTMLQLHPDGSSEVIILGQDILNGQHIQAAVSRGTWQGAFLNQGGNFALLGTTMAPGFESDDFELACREELLKRYPDQRELILKLTQQK